MSELSPAEWRAVRGIVAALLPDPLPPEGPSLDETVRTLERFIAATDSRKVAQVRGLLRAVGTLFPNLDDNPARRAQLRGLFEDPPDGLSTLTSLAQQIAVYPYFAHPDSDALTGYQRPTVRPRHTAADDLPVTTDIPDTIFDVVVVGSGVAGSIVAERLAAAGERVCVLEAGKYWPERLVRDDEIPWSSRLYREAGLLSGNEGTERDSGSFQLLQAWCLGGGGVVNNAVCFQLPRQRYDEWVDEAGFCVGWEAMQEGYARTAADLGIRTLSEAIAPGARMNPAAPLLGLGPARPAPLGGPPGPGLWECLVNMAGCEGLGLCNIGCGPARKTNSLQVHLPRAAAHGAVLVCEARVHKLAVNRRDGVKHAVVVDSDGRRHQVRAKRFVLAAGSVATAEILDRSGIHGRLPIGERFSANVASPLFALYPERVQEGPATQIAHFWWPEDAPSFVVETWFNAPGAHAIAMPGALDKHFERVCAYDRTIAAAVLVGSGHAGRIKATPTGVKVSLPFDDCRDALVRGLARLASGMLRGDGTRHPNLVLGPTAAGFPMRDGGDVERFRQAHLTQPLAALKTGTGHPAGGTAMSADADIAVVGEDFAVRGVGNLYVADASLFPMSPGVNPQWTVMALADRCAAAMG